MEDMINALLDVVRAQHTAAEGTDTEPFDMDDIVDMALNILGRPEEEAEQKEVISNIEDMVHSLAPDIFPPKTFDQLDDQEKIQSAANMIEQSLRNGTVRRAGRVSIPRGTDIRAGQDFAAADSGQDESPYFSDDQVDAYLGTSDQEESDDFDPHQAADLNDLIYNNFMQMMGMKEPQVEYPFDRSQIRYGREKTVTEMLAEEEEAREKAEREEKETRRKMSAWELAQSAVDKDEAAHQKEEYVPKPMEMPATKSASQMAAEAIARSREEDSMKTEIERRAEQMMEEARKRGMDPMAFALHQQEILRYMEKNSDELVSFEDYEDLTPEEKYEIEQRMEEEKRREAEANTAQAEAASPSESRPDEGETSAEKTAPVRETGEEDTSLANPAPEQKTETAGEEMPVMSEEMLLALSQEVLRENADMILADDANEDMENLNQVILENIRKMMAGSGAPVSQEPVADLLDQVDKRHGDASAAAAMEQPEEADSTPADRGDGSLQAALASALNPAGTGADNVTVGGGGGGQGPSAAAREAGPLSAAELAKAAQRAAGIKQPEDPVVTKSAAEIAREAQERSRQRLAEEEMAEAAETTEAGDTAMDMDALTSELAKAMEEMGGELNEEKAIALLRQRLAAMDMDESQLVLSEDDLEMPDLEMPASEEDKAEEETSPLTSDEDKKDRADSSQEDTEEGENTSGETTPASNDKADVKSISQEKEEELDLSDLNEEDLFSEFDDILTEKESDSLEVKQPEEADDLKEVSVETSMEEIPEEPASEDISLVAEDPREDGNQEEPASENETQTEDEIPDEEEDASAYVLGEHTQAEIDEAIENLNTLGLEGEVYERAKNLLLLEMAGSEEVLEAWLKEQEENKNRKAAPRLEDDEIETIEDLDEDLLEEELKEALDGDFGTDSDASEETPEEAGEAEEDAGAEETEQEAAGEDTEPDLEPGAEPASEQETVPEAAYDQEETVLETVEPIIEEAAPTVEETDRTFSRRHGRKERHVVRKRERTAAGRSDQKAAFSDGYAEKTAAGKDSQVGETADRSKEYQVSVRSPFVLRNSASFLDKFEEYIVDTQENRKLSTGFKKLDAMLRYGLHKGSYFIDAEPQYLKNGFMQQIADHSAESGVDVLYISTELSRYDLMVETISRLSYEIHGKDVDKAVSPMAIMTGADGADLASLKDELNWYRGRISEHLFILDQEAVEEFTMDMENVSAGVILEELIRSIVREGAHKPVVFIDNIENILSAEDSEAMKPLMEGIRKLARELGIPIIMSYGYAQAESEERLYPSEKEFHESLGNMCDVYMELQYADMVTEDFEELSEDDILEMMEDGDTLLIDIHLKKNRRTMKATCQIQAAPKFNFFEE